MRNRQREREIQRERGAFAGDGRNLDAPTQRRDFGAHDVHADAPSGYLRDVRRGRESGRKNAFDQPRLGRVGIGRNEFELARLVRDAAQIEARAVVRELDRDFIALLVDVERDFARFRLARLAPGFPVLEAMVERVAQ